MIPRIAILSVFLVVQEYKGSGFIQAFIDHSVYMKSGFLQINTFCVTVFLFKGILRYIRKQSTVLTFVICHTKDLMYEEMTWLSSMIGLGSTKNISNNTVRRSRIISRRIRGLMSLFGIMRIPDKMKHRVLRSRHSDIRPILAISKQ